MRTTFQPPVSAGEGFRPLRLDCSISLEGEQRGSFAAFRGSTVLLARGALQADVRVPAGEVPLLTEGATVRVVVRPPDDAGIELRGRLRWHAASAETRALALDQLDGAAEAAARWIAVVDGYRPAVLVVDRDRHHQALVARALSSTYRVVSCESAADAFALLEREEFAVLVTEQRLSDLDGPGFLDQVSRRYPRANAVRLMTSAFTKAEDVQDLINLGRLFHYLRKPVIDSDLLQVVDRAARSYALAVENQRLALELQQANRRLRTENADLRKRLRSAEDRGELMGRSPSFLRALGELDRLRTSDAPVHIAGETGTGKELVARALHDGSARAGRPFVAQNCGALGDNLLLSALFGHCRGAFTGADRSQAGLFQAAHGGTLFLDEVAELSPQAQAALLRAVQHGEVVPVGAARATRVDVRILSATHRDLRAEVRAGRFREDLFFRLVVMQVSLPPLRDRPCDVLLLARHFLRELEERAGKEGLSFAAATGRALERYGWPGNVRELRNEVERLVVLGESGFPLDAELLSPHVAAASAPDGAGPPSQPPSPAGLPPDSSYDDAVRAYERALVAAALESGRGVVARAAELLGMERSRLSKLRQRLGLV